MAMENSLYMWFLKIIGNYGKNPLQMEVSSENHRTLAGGFSTFSQAELLPELDTPIEKVMESLKLTMTGGVRVAIKRVTWIDLGDGLWIWIYHSAYYIISIYILSNIGIT